MLNILNLVNRKTLHHLNWRFFAISMLVCLLTVIMTLTVSEASSVTDGVGGDIPGNATTTDQLVVGQTRNGTIDFGGDRDWFAITLNTGERYTFDLEGASNGKGTLNDPLRSQIGITKFAKIRSKLLGFYQTGANMLSVVLHSAIAVGSLGKDCPDDFGQRNFASSCKLKKSCPEDFGRFNFQPSYRGGHQGLQPP